MLDTVAPDTRFPSALPVGSMVSGYTIRRVLGQGGFGITYEAFNSVTGRQFALKEFFPQGAVRREDKSRLAYSQSDYDTISWALAKFRETTTTLAALSHPNIVQVHDYVPANETGYMIMELLDGESLNDWLNRRPAPPTLAELRPLLDPVLQALGYVHGKRLIHRDIAPDNILITRDGRPVLIDFGAVSRDVSGMSRVAATRGVEKVGYTAPEQARAEVQPKPTADIYSLGAVLYHALSGDTMMSGSERAIAQLSGPDPLTPLAQRRLPQVPASVAAVIDNCLAMLPSKRPQTVENLREALGWSQPAAAQTAAPYSPGSSAPVPNDHGPRSGNVSPPPSGPISAPVPQGGSSVALIGGLSVLVLAVLAGGGYFAWSLSQAPRTEPTTAGTTTSSPRPSSAALIEACDRAAADPFDTDRPSAIKGVGINAIDANSAISACREAAKAAPKDRRIQFELGRALAAGENFDEAKKQYEAAASAGSTAAMTYIGILFQNGKGTPQDFAAAKTWFEKAAQAGSADAMYSLGVLYLNGQGVRTDYTAARNWFVAAAGAGNVAAMNFLGLIYENGWGVERDVGVARSWYAKAADAGSSVAKDRLSNLDASQGKKK